MKAKANGRLTTGYLSLFGMGGLSLYYIANGIQSYATPVYQMKLGVDPVLLGIAMMIPRLWDAFTDPVMGDISDNFNSRYGRRRPFVFCGAILMAIAFGMIWMVPETWEQGSQVAWFIGFSLLFFTFGTVFGVPMMSLYYEASPDYDERTRVMGFQTFWNRVGELAYQWVFPLSQIAVFSTALFGIRFMGWTAAVFLLLIPGVIPALVGKERFAHVSEKQDRVKLWDGLKSAVKNRAFLILSAIVMMTFITGYIASIMDHYLLVYYVCGGDMAEGTMWKGLLSSTYAVIGFASIPLLDFVSKRIGKNTTFMYVLGLVAVGAVARWWIFRPGAGWFILIDPFLGGAMLWTAFTMITGSMFADICDDDELRHGMRREGLFGAAFSWMLKMGNSLSYLLVGVILNWVGFDAANGGEQAPGTFTGMRIFLSFVPLLSIVVCLFLLKIYPITKQQARETRLTLESRRGTV